MYSHLNSVSACSPKCLAAAAEDVQAPGDDTRVSSSMRPEEKRTLWVGDLDKVSGVIEESYITHHMFLEFAGSIRAVRVCRDKVYRHPSFAFCEFSSTAEAQYVLMHMNGKLVPGRQHKYKLNWASFNLTATPHSKTVYSKPPQLHNAPSAAPAPASLTAPPPAAAGLPAAAAAPGTPAAAGTATPGQIYLMQ